MPAAVDNHPDQQLRPDPDRVIGRLFLPSSEPPHVHRAQDLIRRLLALDEATVSRMLPGRGISPVNVPSASVLIASAVSTCKPSVSCMTGAMAACLPCMVASTARAPA